MRRRTIHPCKPVLHGGGSLLINPIQTSGLNGINSHYNNTSTTITVGMTDESAVTPTVIVALSAHNILSPALIDSDNKQSLQEEEERP